MVRGDANSAVTHNTPRRDEVRLKTEVETATDELDAAVDAYHSLAHGTIRRLYLWCTRDPSEPPQLSATSLAIRNTIAEKIKLLRAAWEARAGDFGMSELELAVADARVTGKNAAVRVFLTRALNFPPNPDIDTDRRMRP